MAWKLNFLPQPASERPTSALTNSASRPRAPPTPHHTMGFLKRLLSAGSKRNKKRSSVKSGETQDLRRYHSQTLPVLSEVESEAAANRLLRSASSRLGAMCYSAGDDPLPPLPNRKCTLSPRCVLLSPPPCKAHPEVDDEAETRSLPFLPNRKLPAIRDA